MSEDLLKVEDWSAVPIEELLSSFRQEGEADEAPRHRSHWRNDGRISDYDLYVYLKARFGPPNGLLMLGRVDSTDNLFQWHYSLTANGIDRIEIMAGNSATEFHVTSETEVSGETWSALPDSIKSDFRRVGKKLLEVRNGLERWSVFINPFCRLERIVHQILQRLSHVEPQEPVLPPNPATPAQADAYSDSLADFTSAVHEVTLLGTYLRFLAPVLAESFLNLLIFVLARSDVKKDLRIYESLIRNPVDIRVRSLHLFCSGFQSAVDCDSDEFKAFHSLMNRRNDVLHGNVDPVRMKFEEVFFDGTIPLFKDARPLIHRAVENTMRGVEKSKAIADVLVVRRFVKRVLSHLLPEIRGQVVALMQEEQPGWREDTGRVGMLFGDSIGQVSLVVDPDDIGVAAVPETVPEDGVAPVPEAAPEADATLEPKSEHGIAPEPEAESDAPPTEGGQ